MENWIETRSGIKVDVQNPQPEQIDVRDVAYSLSNLCRYNGHTAGYFSVAEPSVLVALRLPRRLQLAGLLHDAAEAYLGDVAAPVKQFLPDFNALEKVFHNVIVRKFDLELTEEDWREVAEADKDAAVTEGYFLMGSQGAEWSLNNGPIKRTVNHSLKPMCLPPQYAFELFMGKYIELTESPIILPA